MATPEIVPDSTEPNHFDMLELDITEPELPTWAVVAVAAISAIIAFPPDAAMAALQALIAPLRTRPEGPGKVACRVAMKAKEAEIVAARAKLAAGTAPVVVPVATPAPAATERQAIPTLRDGLLSQAFDAARPQVATALVDTRRWEGSWVPLMNGRTGPRLQSATERRARTVDMWGARMDHAPDNRPVVGSVVRLTRSGARNGTMHVITGIALASPESTIATVRDAQPADLAAPILVAFNPAPQARYEITPSAPVPLSSLMPDASTIEGSLADIATTGQALATATRETGYVEPSERGDGSQQAADTRGIVHTPTGPSIFDQPRSERVFKVGETYTSAQVRSLLGERNFIAGAVAAEGGMLQTSWDGSVRSQTTLGALTDALRAIGRESDAPGVPSAEAYAGKAVAAVGSNRGANTQRLIAASVAKGYEAQWQIGDGTARQNVQAGDAFGRVALVVSLKADDTLDMDGDMTLAQAVRSHYATSVAKEVLRSDVLTAWLQRILKNRHGAVKRGRVWYVPSGQAEAVEALIAAIEPLWGDHETIRVTTAKALAKSLARGLTEEFCKVEKEFGEATERARVAARAQAEKKASKRYNASAEYIAQEGQAAFDRATVSSVVASGLLRDLGTVAARVSGYEIALGTEAVSGVLAQIATLRACLMSLTDDTSARAAMLELD